MKRIFDLLEKNERERVILEFYYLKFLNIFNFIILTDIIIILENVF